MRKLLIANRGEIAIRIAQAAADLGVPTAAVYSEDDATSLHVRRASQAIGLPGRGPRAYLDMAAILHAARAVDADAIHPGYGFLSENAAFARAVEDAGLIFVGPSVETLETFGDKVRAREVASLSGTPVLVGSPPLADAEAARAFFNALPRDGAMVIKAVHGGGGRGMRVVRQEGKIVESFDRAAAEALAAFGHGTLYAEEYLPGARHVEVQIIGDGRAVSHLWERECTLQRRHQKIIEIAPSPSLNPEVRGHLVAAAVRLAQSSSYRSLGTMEFLLGADGRRFCFIEANPRLQVEHTVTEEVLGLDLVRIQLEIARGRSLKQLGLSQSKVPQPRGYAIQARVNLETMSADGAARPGGGQLTVFEAPMGQGVRTDTYGYVGYQTNPAFDSLIAKIICRSPSASFADAVGRLRRALGEMRLDGAPSNLGFLCALLDDPRIAHNQIDTRFIDDHAAAILARMEASRPAGSPKSAEPSRAGARLASADPLAVLDHGRASSPASPTTATLRERQDEPGVLAIRAPMQGTIVSFAIAPGEAVWAGKVIAVMEAMKMQHEIRAEASGRVRSLEAQPGDTVFEDRLLAQLDAEAIAPPLGQSDRLVDLDAIRPDLQEVFDRKAAGRDQNRPSAVAKRHATGRRTARENIRDLCDPGSFVEYGSVVLAAQRRRRSLEDLIANTTGDGMVCGLGSVNGALVGEERARVMAMSYDYMVLAGTQGKLNHYKKDRMFELAEKHRLPTILFAEGGGGRPGDTDATGVAGLDCLAFHYFARLSGLVPLVGITTGRCFAGNAVLLGCCDVIIATEGSNIGVGGPAMIEGGGLGVFKPEEVGPMDVQVPNGVVDIAVKDEAEAVKVAKRYLGYFQGSTSDWSAPDARALRFVVPENRLRYYDMRQVIEGIADIGSVLELRPQWGVGMITAFIRVEGRPIGVIANNPGHLSGAIDAPGADKASRFMQLCDAFDIPVLTLIDCPGIMVGPEIEKTALLRHACRMMVVGANIQTPLMSVVIRKGYGLGAQAMAGGSFRAPLFVVTWPTGEFGGMGLEGAVKLGFRKELQAIENVDERKATYEKMVAQSYQRGKAINMASHFELDEVIDPAETRRWIVAGLKSLPHPPAREGKRRSNVDAW